MPPPTSLSLSLSSPTFRRPQVTLLHRNAGGQKKAKNCQPLFFFVTPSPLHLTLPHRDHRHGDMFL